MKTDTQLQHDVIAELKWEPSIKAEHIGVEVEDGVVTLAGHVDSYGEKWHAERAAQRVAGVMALTVEIEVKLPGPSKRSDVDIARSVENTLIWMVWLPKDSVKVKVESGWVTLSGEVEWAYQRSAAASAVRYLMGVTGVSDTILVRPSISLSAVKLDIEAALKRRAGAHAKKISVEIEGSEVTLSGKVDTWSEREMAAHSAWSTPGVRSVVDNITVTY